jgi:hypothetical protein
LPGQLLGKPVNADMLEIGLRDEVLFFMRVCDYSRKTGSLRVEFAVLISELAVLCAR